MKIEIYLPEKTINSSYLKKRFSSFNKEKFENKIGIYERRQSHFSQSSLELSINACKKLFEHIDKSDIDFIVYCTQTPKYILPGNSTQLQSSLKLDCVPSFDFNLGCSGYVYGLGISKSLIESGLAKNILLVTSDTYTKFINKQDKSNRSIFGDGSTCTLVDISLAKKMGKFVLGSDGSKHENLIIRNGGGYSKYENNAKIIEYGQDNFYTHNDLYMEGIEIFNWTIKKIPDLVKETLKKNLLRIDDIDYFIFHQANAYMLTYLRKKIRIPENKFHLNLEKTGNTVSSTIPIALKECFEKKLIKKNMKVMLVGFGVGLSWGATIIKF